MEADGTWKPVPKEETQAAAAAVAEKKKADEEVEMIDLSDDEEGSNTPRPPPANMEGQPPYPCSHPYQELKIWPHSPRCLQQKLNALILIRSRLNNEYPCHYILVLSS